MLRLIVPKDNHRGWYQPLFRSAFDETTPKHVKDAYTGVEFIKWVPSSQRMQLDPVLMRSVPLQTLKFAPMRMATSDFYAFCQEIEPKIKEDLVMSFILPFMMYTSPTLLVLTPQSAYIGSQLRDTEFPYTYSSCHTMRMLKSCLIYIQNMKVAKDDAAKKESIEWDATKSSLATAIEKKIRTNRTALFGTVREINGIHGDEQKEADEKWTRVQQAYGEEKKRLDETLASIDKKNVEERQACVKEAVEKRKEFEAAKKEWEEAKKKGPDVERFLAEHKQYSLHLIRAMELHLMMLNGAPMDSGVTFFTSSVFPSDDEVHSQEELNNCAKIRTTQAIDLNEAFKRFGTIYPRAEPVRKLMDRCKDISEKAKAPFAYGSLLAKEIPPMSELEYSTGIFNIISAMQKAARGHVKKHQK